MDLTPHSAVQRATIGTAAIRQHDLRVLEQGRTVVLGVALGPPRLWSYLLAGTLDAFDDGFHRPHDGRMSTRLHQGLRVAQQALRTRVDSLIERHPSDVGLMALALEAGVLHVLCAGPLRAYLHRRKSTRRLSAREEGVDGVLKVPPNWCAEQVEAGDLVFVTALSGPQQSALDQLRSELDAGRPLEPKQVVERLIAPAADEGLGGIAVAYRVPSFVIDS